MQNSGDKEQKVIKTAPRARGRPRAFDREEALGHATRLFWKKGYEATSITDLVEAMGIGSPSLYAAFESKEALYAEAIDYYARNYSALIWGSFESAPTAREAVKGLLFNSAKALRSLNPEIPSGCMVALSSVGSEGHVRLGELVRGSRATGLNSLTARLRRGVQAGEIPTSVDIAALARFVQAVYNGMSILARDGTCRDELEGIAEVALAGWDAHLSLRTPSKQP